MTIEQKYPNLFFCIKDFCLLKNIVTKQKEHIDIYPDDIKTIRALYNDYPKSGWGSPAVEKFIAYVNFLVGKMIGYTRTTNSDIYKAIYSYGNNNTDKMFLENVLNTIRGCELEMCNSFNSNYDFYADKTKLSNYNIETYIKESILKAKTAYQFNYNEFIDTHFYKSYMTGSYVLSLDYIDTKLNGDFYGRYVQLSVNTIKNGIDFFDI